MEKRFSDVQIISILKEAEAGLAVKELSRKLRTRRSPWILSWTHWRVAGGLSV